MKSKEKILFTLKDNKDLRKEVLSFVKQLTGQPVELLDAALTDYLNSERETLLKEYEGKRSMMSIKYLWDAQKINIEEVRTQMHKTREDDKRADNLKKKTLLAKNVKLCPSCQSDNTYLSERRENNGIMGPGYSSWVVESHWECNDCGIHFTPKNDVIK
jgi:hypothetical protein